MLSLRASARVLNYDPNATLNNGSCVLAYEGCMRSDADNYDPLASRQGKGVVCIFNPCASLAVSGCHRNASCVRSRPVQTKRSRSRLGLC